MTISCNQSIIVPMTRITMANKTTSYEHTRNIRYTLEWVRTITALLILAMQIVILAKLFGG